MDVYAVVETGFYFDNIARAYMFRGIMQEKLSLGLLRTTDICKEELLVLQMPDDDFNATVEDNRLRKGLPSSFFAPYKIYKRAKEHKGLELSFYENFDGSAKTNSAICDSENSGIDESFSEDNIVYLPLEKKSSLLQAAYTSIDEIIDEIKEKIGAYFPADFDFASRICDIDGASVLY